MKVEIRNIRIEDCGMIAKSFTLQNWNKSIEQFKTYFIEQEENKRVVLVASINGEFAGYLTILWQSEYPYFIENKIPEIKDLNVLIKFQKLGIA
jgi:hypothetical protein